MERAQDPGKGRERRPGGPSGPRRQGARGIRPLASNPTLPPGTVRRLQSLDQGGSRFLVVIGDAEVTVSAELIAEFHLRAGAELSGADAERLAEGCRALAVFDRAVALLASRARSRRELGIALQRRGATKPDVERAVDRLVALGLLDDARYARQVAESAARQGKARALATRELRRRGIDQETARESIQAAFPDDPDAELMAALEAGERRLRSLAKLAPDVARRRLYGFLARRGYGARTCAAVIKRLLAPGRSPREEALED